MFGFLKQKIADFGNKLKQTVTKEEEKTKPVEKKEDTIKELVKEEILPKKEEKVELIKEQTKSKKETISETKKETIETKPVEIKKPETIQTPQTKKDAPATEKIEVKKEIETKIKETPKEEITVEARPQETPKKKEGLLGKLFGFGKKREEKKEEIKEEKKKKTKEELAEEMEAKMFAEIEAEVKKEEEKKPEFIIKKEIETKKEELKVKPIEKEILSQKTITKVEQEEKIELPKEIEKELEEEEEEVEQITTEAPTEKIYEEKSRDIYIKTLDEDKRELKAKVGVASGLKGMLFGGVEITEKQIADLLWELELSLIESDVEQEAASELVNQIKKRLIGTKTSAKNIDEYLKEQIKEILSEMMKTEKINLLEEVKKHSPLKILMIGPNGAGKTTSIAKLVNYFQKNKKTCIVAAADTFRAGAIDQLEVHANKLGVRVIKQQYGADPAAVAFDAVKAAEAGKIDVVIIDSAGRQETNKNLMEELRKIERVAKPDLKLYVGEAYVGQTLLDQVAEFKEIVGIDGFILTKIDTDAKGGTAISLLYKMKKPILFVGTGQGYDDFKEFTPEFILERII